VTSLIATIMASSISSADWNLYLYKKGFCSQEQIVIGRGYILKLRSLCKHSDIILGHILLLQKRLMYWCIVMVEKPISTFPKMGAFMVVIFSQTGKNFSVHFLN
jgi:hypothetical protein